MDQKIQKSKFIYGQYYDCIWRQIEKLLKLLLGLRTASNTAFGHQQLYYCYHPSESSEFAAIALSAGSQQVFVIVLRVIQIF